MVGGVAKGQSMNPQASVRSRLSAVMPTLELQVRRNDLELMTGHAAVREGAERSSVKGWRSLDVDGCNVYIDATSLDVLSRPHEVNS